jgi:hypothetical protein
VTNAVLVSAVRSTRRQDSRLREKSVTTASATISSVSTGDATCNEAPIDSPPTRLASLRGSRWRQPESPAIHRPRIEQQCP